MLTREAIEAILTAGDWSDFVGEIETDLLECKGMPYDLANEAHRMELAKDVSALANAQGGVLLLGVSTKRSATLAFDEISALNPFPVATFTPQQYMNVIGAWVYPVIEGLRVEWCPDPGDPARGYGVIRVPAQQRSRGPFIICKTVLASGRRTEILFGYAERRLDANDPATAGDLQRWLRDGMGFQQTIEQRLEELKVLLAQGSPAPTPIPDVTARITNALQATGLGDEQHYVLAAYPLQSALLPSIFTQGPGSIARLLENPPVLRFGGWSLETLDHTRIIEGQYLRVTSGRRKVIDLYRDGTFIFAGLANRGFLGTTSASDALTTFPKLNTLALVEVTYLFCLFYGAVIGMLDPPPARILIRRVLGHMHPDGERRTYLNPAPNDHIAHLAEGAGDIHFAPRDAADEVLEVDATSDPGRTAYQLMETLFLWFGIPPGQVPYSVDAGGTRVIDSTVIARRR